MAFPTTPTDPSPPYGPLAIPLWATDPTSQKVNPIPTQRVDEFGWIVISGQQYGQIPPFQWVNWTNFQIGQWLNFLCGPLTSTTGAISYLQSGYFDSGVSLFNTQELKFYNANAPTTLGTPNYFTSLRASSGLSGNAQFILPPSIPDFDNMPLIGLHNSSLVFGDTIVIKKVQFYNLGVPGNVTIQAPSSAMSGTYTLPNSPPGSSGSALISDTGGTLSWVHMSYLWQGNATLTSCPGGSFNPVLFVQVGEAGTYAVSAVVHNPSGIQFEMTIAINNPNGSGGSPAKDILSFTSALGTYSGSLVNVNYNLAANDKVYLNVKPTTTESFSGYLTCMKIQGSN